MLIQQCLTSRQKLIIVGRMVYYHRWIHLEHDQKYRLGQIELKARSRRTARVGQCKPLSTMVIACRPEFSRSVPRGSMLLIDTVLKKIVRAGLVSSMMEMDGPLRRFFFGLMGACHDERTKFFLSDRPSWKALNLRLFYLLQQWLTRLLLSNGQRADD